MWFGRRRIAGSGSFPGRLRRRANRLVPGTFPEGMDVHGEDQNARNMTMKRLPVSNRHFRERMMDRRTFLGAAAAGAALAGGLVSSTVSATTGTVKVGFLASPTGEMAARGLPGLHGCELWAEKVRAAGGVRIGDGTYDAELVPFDDEHDATKAITGATKLIFEDGCRLEVAVRVGDADVSQGGRKRERGSGGRPSGWKRGCLPVRRRRIRASDRAA